MPYSPISSFVSPLGYARHTNFKREVTFYDRVRFVGATSTLEIFGGALKGDLYSSDWDGGFDLSGGKDGVATVGYLLDYEAGAAQFQTIYADGGSLTNLDIDGSLTILSGGNIRTAASGARFVLTSFTVGTGMYWYTGHASEMVPAFVGSQISGTNAIWGFIGPQIGSGANYGSAQINFQADTAGQGTLTMGATSVGTYDAYTQVSASASGAGTSEVNFTADEITTAGDLTQLTGVWRLLAGTAADPSLAFDVDPDTGMYRVTTDSIGFATGGSNVVTMGPTWLRMGPSLTGSPVMYEGAGSAGAPGYSFSSDANTGMYRIGTDILGLVAGGTHGLSLSANSLHTINATTGNAQIKISGAGSITGPTYTFRGDSNTGMWRSGTDEVALTAGSEEMFTGAQVTSAANQVRILPAYDNSVASGDDTVGVTSTGLLRRQTSTLRNKERIEPADWLADISLEPVEYDTKRPENYRDEDEFVSRHGYGLIAEQVAAVLPHAANYGIDGRVENFQDRAILAILAAKVNRLTKQVNSGTLDTTKGDTK